MKITCNFSNDLNHNVLFSQAKLMRSVRKDEKYERGDYTIKVRGVPFNVKEVLTSSKHSYKFSVDLILLGAPLKCEM